MSLPSRLAVVDLETTGVDPNRDRITEIAVIHQHDRDFGYAITIGINTRGF